MYTILGISIFVCNITTNNCMHFLLSEILYVSSECSMYEQLFRAAVFALFLPYIFAVVESFSMPFFPILVASFKLFFTITTSVSLRVCIYARVCLWQNTYFEKCYNNFKILISILGSLNIMVVRKLLTSNSHVKLSNITYLKWMAH